MNNLIKIEVNENQEQLVSGRELHEFLEIKTRYNDWFERMVGYGFVENTDYVAITQKRVTAQGNEIEYTDHAIKIDMAKEISMIQRSEKGKQVRLYFIEAENKYKQLSLDTTQLSPELQMFNSLYKAIANTELEQKQIKQDIADTKQDIQGIRDVVALNSTNWREDTSRLIATMARKLGNLSHIQDLRRENYEILEQRMACRLGIRLTNKKKTQAENGVCKSKRDKLNNLDVIADDKKLTEVAIVKEMAIKYGVVAS
ncbi:antA/AntB antirepressor family protein [Metaclostridioides mangenotii]|uniref:antA/AntB antirepressor family protein n=1 Tax=Metaclostridioides mangenotii TaxID=1540 RepID=UPI0004642EDE|nr:antA/AntB antirepressor family protein [Clostridioides mangenotii]